MQNGDVIDLSGLGCHGGPHTHCFSCYSFVHCTVKDGSVKDDHCDFTTCPKCGWVFHGCKSEEHTLLCAVDFDFLLRDQRALETLRNLPRQTKLALRNHLTRRYPAVPLPNQVTNPGQSLKLDWYERQKIPIIDETKEDISYIGGRQAEMTKQMKIWQDDLDERLKGKKIPPKYWEFPELEKGNIHKHCSNCFDLQCQRTHHISDPEETSCPLTKCRWECGQVFHMCKAGEHFMICPNYVEPDEFAWMYRGVTGEKNTSRKRKNNKEGKNKTAWPSIGDLGVGPGTSATSILQGKALNPRRNLKKSLKGITVPAPPSPSAPLGDLYQNSFLNIRMDTIRRQHSKPKSMYTFVCSQQFRRDEYEWHCKNVHDDILGGMDNWMEVRCPLASLGCGFSARRMFPGNAQKTLFYSPAVESFGLKPSNVLVTPSKSSKSRGLLDMPNEIIFEIIKVLDSFSISNLSLTCGHLRQLCSVMLDSKGCVTPRWERVITEVPDPMGYGKNPTKKTTSWKIAYNQWFFSTAMEPITHWTFRNDQKVSDHLKSCPYNVRTGHDQIPKEQMTKFGKSLAKMNEMFEMKRKLDPRWARGDSGYLSNRWSEESGMVL